MKKNLTGMTFGDLYVVGVSEISRNGHYRYHVKCACGTEKTVFGTHLLKGTTKSCGCLRTKTSSNWQGYKGVGKTYWSHVQKGAKGERGRRPISFEVSLEYIADLLEAQDYKCALSGLPISAKEHTASLDRIDSSKGYTEDNVQWLHKDINMMKRHYNQNYFIHMCKLVGGVCEIVDING